MSWDVWVFKPPPGLIAIADLTADYQLPPIENRSAYVAAVAAFGTVECVGWIEDGPGGGTYAPVALRDASFLRVDGPDVYADIGLPDGTGSLTLNVYGGTEGMVAAIVDFATRLDARALDIQTGDWLTVDAGLASFGRWGAYRDRVVAPPDDES